MKEKEKTSAETITNGERNGIKRRSFVKLLGGGIFIIFRPWNALDLLSPLPQERRTLTKDYNAFLHVQPDGMITCYTGKIEMGQGIITSLPMMMADELNVPIEKIKMVMGDTELCPYDAGTWGSQTTQTFGPAMRAALAEARSVLLDMAAVQLGVPVSRLEVKDGIVVDKSDPKKKLSYAQLAKGKKLEKYLDVKPPVEDYTKFTYVSKPYMKVDSYEKVTGKAKFTGDLVLPGMVHARILRPPSHGAKLTSADVSAADKIDGVKVVRDGDFIAVVSENRDKVDEAIVKIKAEYSFDELKVNDKTVFDRMLSVKSASNVVRNEGDIVAGNKLSDKVFET